VRLTKMRPCLRSSLTSLRPATSPPPLVDPQQTNSARSQSEDRRRSSKDVQKLWASSAHESYRRASSPDIIRKVAPDLMQGSGLSTHQTQLLRLKNRQAGLPALTIHRSRTYPQLREAK